jgi:predicted Zn-dependent protease
MPAPFPVRLAAVAGLLACSGCESTNVAPMSGEATVLADDEQRLWLRAREESAVLDRSGLIVNDPALEDFLNGVLDRLYRDPLPRGGRLQLRVLTDPTLNAFALPDGALYIHTGMLARLENEAQFATVLAHELTHTTHRHALKGFRHLKNQTGFLATFTGITGGVGGLLGLLSTAASVSGYSKDLEREADREGYRLLVSAGYDPRESSKVFQLLLDESKRSKIKQPYFFGSHPRLAERRDTFAELARAHTPGENTGRVAAEAYAAALSRVFRLNAVAALQAGDHDAALFSIRRHLALHPDNLAAQLVEADIHRRRNAEGDAALALAGYQRIAAAADAPAAAHRGIGLVLFKQGDKPGAAAAFRRYLELEPEADDRAYIEDYLKLCEANS